MHTPTKELDLRDYFAARAPKLTFFQYLYYRSMDWDLRRETRSWNYIDTQHRYRWAEAMLRARKRTI